MKIRSYVPIEQLENSGIEVTFQIPQDLFLLLIWKEEGTIVQQLEQLPKEILLSLLAMIYALEHLIYHVAFDLWMHSNIIVTSDDGYVHFCSHVLSLTERIIPFLQNPYRELQGQYRYYYYKGENPNSTINKPGYLTYDFYTVLSEDGTRPRTVEQAIEWLENYQDLIPT